MVLISAIACAVLIGLDQATKFLALTRLKPIDSMTAVKGFLDFTFVENRGAAFGILHGKRWFFVILTVAVSVVMIVAFFKMPKNKQYNWVRLCLVLLFSGAVVYLIDRMFHGYVIDFLEVTFISWPVFNLADVFVVTGTLILAYLLFFVIKDEPKKEK